MSDKPTEKKTAPDHTPPRGAPPSMLNVSQVERLWKFLVYGATGTGKTTLGVTAPDPVFLLSEAQGYESVRDAAARMGKPVPPVFLVQTVDGLRAAVLSLRSGAFSQTPLHGLVESLLPRDQWAAAKAALPYAKPKTIVVDSITEFFKVVADEVEREAPMQVASDGLPDRSLRHMGVIKDRCERLVRSLRDLPYHVVVLAAQSDQEIGQGKEKSRKVAPDTVVAKLQGALAHAANAVGVASKVEVADKNGGTRPAWGVNFVLPGHFMSKVARPLRDAEVPNVSSWVKRLDANSKALDGGTRDASGDAPVAEPPTEEPGAARPAEPEVV